jgi:hypothetical protein
MKMTAPKIVARTMDIRKKSKTLLNAAADTSPSSTDMLSREISALTIKIHPSALVTWICGVEYEINHTKKNGIFTQ